jgi:hypothetical protein
VVRKATGIWRDAQALPDARVGRSGRLDLLGSGCALYRITAR